MEFSMLKKVKKTNKRCPVHGVPFVTFGGFEPFCPDCRKEETKAKDAAMLKDLEDRNYRRRTVETLEKDSIIGDPLLWKAEFATYTPDNQESQRAFEASMAIANKYLDREKQFNTIFTGTPGVGKSHLAMSILKAVNAGSDPYTSCLFVSVNDLLRLIKDSISNKQSRYTEDNMIRLLTKVDLLVLDDLGSESSFKRETSESSEFNQRVLFAILNARSRTIVTTNLNSDELNEIYNPKIISRIYRGVEGHVIKFTKATKDKRSKISF